MEREIFDKKFVYFMWDGSLKDKECFTTDNIDMLQDYVETYNYNFKYVIDKSNDSHYPFRVVTGDNSNLVYRFVYYDPLYDVKWAWKQGKRIQCRAPSGAWLDIPNPNWDGSSLELRVKPDEPVYRPFKDIQELKSTFLNLLPSSITPANAEPMIWVRSKSNTSSTFMITHFCENMGVVYLCGHLNVSLEELFEDYTFLDGGVIGVAYEE